MPPIKSIQLYLEESMPNYMELLRKMVEINSFTANAQGVNQLGNLTAQIFSQLGFEADFVPSNHSDFGQHLFLKRAAREDLSSQAHTIAMVSHLDTVFPAEEEALNHFNFRLEGDRIYGPGTVDIKGGSIVMFMILDALQQFAAPVFESTDWVLAFNASEEVLSDDFGKHLLQRLPETTSTCLVFEGGTPISKAVAGSSEQRQFIIVNERKGRATFLIQVTGRGAHAGNYHASGANAVVQMAHTILELAALTDYDRQVTVNVGTVKGGNVINRVPHYAEAGVDLRAFSPQVFQETIEKIQALGASSQVKSQDGFACKVSVKTIDRTSPWPKNPATQALFEIWRENAQKIGGSIQAEARGGLSDGNFFWHRFPTIDGLGPVGANAHCSERSPDGSKDQEYALRSSFVPKALLNILSIIQLIESRSRLEE